MNPRLVLKDLLKQELDISDWDVEAYPIVAAALRYNTSFTKLKANGKSKGEAVSMLASALENNPTLTELDFRNCDMA